MNLDAITGVYSAIPTDWMILGVFAIFAAFDILRSGARRACTAALALPIALLLFVTTENATFIGDIVRQFSTPILQAVLVGILFAAAFVTISRIGLSWGGETGQTIQAAVGGVALAAIVTTLWLATPALQEVWSFGPQVAEIFGESYRFFWLFGSYAALAFVRNG